MSINEDSDFDKKVSQKRKYIRRVVDSLVGESKLLWKPTKLTFHKDGGWENVRVAVPFNNHKTTPAPYFKGEGSHQDLFKVGFEDFVEDIYALSKGETYYVYNLYLKEMYTRISYFIKENTIDDEPNENPFAINEENIFKKYGRKLYSKLTDIAYVNEKFVEKMANYIEQKYDEVINVTWTYDMYQKIELKVYIDEDDGHRTDIGVHPLESKIRRELNKDWHIGMDKDSHLWLLLKVINLNKDTKLRSSVRESINESFRPYNDSVLNKDWVDKVVKRMVDKTEINLYMEDYDPWKQGNPFFGNIISPDFGDNRRAKYNISWFIDERKHIDIQPPFARELIETYGFSTNGELKYFESEYRKQIKDKVKLLQIPFIEKRQKQKEEYGKRKNIRMRHDTKLRESRKDVKKEMDEIQRVVQDLSRHHNFNTTVEDVSTEIENATPQPLKYQIWNQLENSESVDINKGDFDEVFKIANKYQKGNPLKLKKKFIEGNYRPPIIARFDDRYWLVAGNTRLCTAKSMGINPNVLIIDLNKTHPVDESKIPSVIKQYLNENLI